MYAIVQVGGSQYRVAKGDVIKVSRVSADEGKAVNFDKIVLFSDGKGEVRIGQPFLKGYKVSAEVLRHFSGKKTTAFKYLRRKHYMRKHGHRELLTEVKVKELSEK